MSTPVNCGTSFCSCIECVMPECVMPDREELEKAVADAWRDYDIADAKLMAYYKENT